MKDGNVLKNAVWSSLNDSYLHVGTKEKRLKIVDCPQILITKIRIWLDV